MDDLLHQALADQVRAELALRDTTAKAATEAIGISSTAWQTYFKRRSRDIPMSVLVNLADFLDMPLWRLIEKAEMRAADLNEHDLAAERALGRMSPEARARARRIAREIRDDPEEPAVAERSTPA